MTKWIIGLVIGVFISGAAIAAQRHPKKWDNGDFSEPVFRWLTRSSQLIHTLGDDLVVTVIEDKVTGACYGFGVSNGAPASMGEIPCSSFVEK